MPPPVGPHAAAPSVAAVEVGSSPEADYVRARDARAGRVASRVHDNILKAQQRNADRQAHLLASRRPRRGKKLQPGDLAYVLQRGLGKKNAVTGPFAVESVSPGSVSLRTTRNVPDQEVRYFSTHIERVARCTTAADVLEKLLRAAGPSIKPPTDHLAAQLALS